MTHNVGVERRAVPATRSYGTLSPRHSLFVHRRCSARPLELMVRSNHSRVSARGTSRRAPPRITGDRSLSGFLSSALATTNGGYRETPISAVGTKLPSHRWYSSLRASRSKPEPFGTTNPKLMRSPMPLVPLEGYSFARGNVCSGPGDSRRSEIIASSVGHGLSRPGLAYRLPGLRAKVTSLRDLGSWGFRVPRVSEISARHSKP